MFLEFFVFVVFVFIFLERKKKNEVEWAGKVGKIWEKLGKGEHPQNKLYEKNFNKKFKINTYN